MGLVEGRRASRSAWRRAWLDGLRARRMRMYWSVFAVVSWPVMGSLVRMAA